MNNDDNVAPKPNIIEEIINSNENDTVDDLDDSLAEANKLKKRSLKDLRANNSTSSLPANFQIHELKKMKRQYVGMISDGENVVLCCFHEKFNKFLSRLIERCSIICVTEAECLPKPPQINNF